MEGTGRRGGMRDEGGAWRDGGGVKSNIFRGGVLRHHHTGVDAHVNCI